MCTFMVGPAPGDALYCGSVCMLSHPKDSLLTVVRVFDSPSRCHEHVSYRFSLYSLWGAAVASGKRSTQAIYDLYLMFSYIRDVLYY